MLDTNILSELMRAQPDPCVEMRFESEPETLFTSVICVEGIRCGAKIAPPGNKLWERFITDIRPYLTALPLTEVGVLRAGDLRAGWKTEGTPVGYRDGLIAATALAHGLILVTRNVRHFDHVTGLQTQNWFEPPETPIGDPA